MAPLRSRANRNQGDDETSILKGLPIRQWQLTEEIIGPPPEIKPEVRPKGFREVPMPQDYRMLPEISQQLLWKARHGQIFHSPLPATNGNDDKSKNGKEVEGGFVSKKWTLIARDKEGEEPSYLAKRRKGLPPTFGAAITNLNPQASYRTTKVKKYDAEGKLHVYEVLAPEGQQVEGEIVAEDEAAKTAPVEPVAAAPGTVVEGVGVVNEHGVVVSNDLLLPTPPRRKPPPPRRKPKKGPGRGKKKVLFENGEAVPTDGSAVGGLLNVPGIAGEQATDSAQPSSQADTPMPDAGDDDEGSGSEGEDGDDGEDGREEGELSPSPEPENGSAAPQTSNGTPASNSAAAAAAAVKEEAKDDVNAMMMDTDALKATMSDPTIADASALPGLAQILEPESLAPPQPETTTSSDAPMAVAPSSSLEVPLASAPTSEVSQIPGLPSLESMNEPDMEATKPDVQPIADEEVKDDDDDYDPPAVIDAAPALPPAPHAA